MKNINWKKWKQIQHKTTNWPEQMLLSFVDQQKIQEKTHEGEETQNRKIV